VSHAPITSIEAYGPLAVLVLMAAVVGLVIWVPRDRALATHRSDW
jgi:hypothetical protein